MFVTKHRSVSWGRKRRFLCPGANKSCLVFLGAGPDCVSVSHLYRIEINNPVYAIIMNRKHKLSTFLEILTFLINDVGSVFVRNSLPDKRVILRQKKEMLYILSMSGS